MVPGGHVAGPKVPKENLFFEVGPKSESKRAPTSAKMAKHGRRYLINMSWLTFLELCWAMLGQVGPTMSPMSPQVGQHDPKIIPKEHPHGHNMRSKVPIRPQITQEGQTWRAKIGPTDCFNLLGAMYTTHTTRPGGMREAIQ